MLVIHIIFRHLKTFFLDILTILVNLFYFVFKHTPKTIQFENIQKQVTSTDL